MAGALLDLVVSVLSFCLCILLGRAALKRAPAFSDIALGFPFKVLLWNIRINAFAPSLATGILALLSGYGLATGGPLGVSDQGVLFLNGCSVCVAAALLCTAIANRWARKSVTVKARVQK